MFVVDDNVTNPDDRVVLDIHAPHVCTQAIPKILMTQTRGVRVVLHFLQIYQTILCKH